MLRKKSKDGFIFQVTKQKQIHFYNLREVLNLAREYLKKRKSKLSLIKYYFFFLNEVDLLIY